MSKSAKDAQARGPACEKVQSTAGPLTTEVSAWLARNITAQEARYQAIVAEMERLTPEREQWIAEFLEIIQTRGFTVTGDTRRVIKPEQIPARPKRKHVVVF